MNTRRNIRARQSGFTLIELMIVVGIIAVLVVVLAIAILPWITKSDEKSSRALLQQVGPVIAGDPKSLPTLKKFRNDAGALSGRISSDDHTARSQMILFYLAPSREIWEQSDLYANRNYDPKLQPADFAEFTIEKSGQLPYLVDAFENPIWYEYDPKLKRAFVLSKGANGAWGDDDDLIYMAGSNEVKSRDEMK